MTSSPLSGNIDRDTLVRYLNEYLEADQGDDYCPNGLQVEGRSRISRIVTGVSACQELFQIARRDEAQAVLVHHGLFWSGDSPVLTGIQYRRVLELIQGEISLIAYHLPLDRHMEVGNNAVAAQRLGLTDIRPFCDHQGLPLGVVGLFSESKPREQVFEALQQLYGQEPLSFPYGKDLVQTVGLVSGSGGRCFHRAIELGLDLFVTGEAEEWTMNIARESQTNFAAAGHYATERLGVQTLGDRIRQQFGLDVTFIDLPNPV